MFAGDVSAPKSKRGRLVLLWIATKLRAGAYFDPDSLAMPLRPVEAPRRTFVPLRSSDAILTRAKQKRKKEKEKDDATRTRQGKERNGNEGFG